MSLRTGNTIPVLIVLAAILLFWYVMAVWMNAPWQQTLNQRAGLTDVPVGEFVSQTWSQAKPLLPAPHQVAAEVWTGTVETDITSRRSLAYHAWITLSATLYGFALGTLLGIALAVVIVHNDASDRSLMPWIIASQTVPILAVAPVIVVLFFNLLTGQNLIAQALRLNADGAQLASKGVISMYLSFFPVVVGMVKGLRSPELIQLDLMRTYNATVLQTLRLLRWPAAVPFLFASMKVGVAASLVGAIVAELPTGAQSGIGAKLLIGSYNGQTIQIWSALILASILAGLLVAIVGMIERVVVQSMGARA